jgi:hypothetical protein
MTGAGIAGGLLGKERRAYWQRLADDIAAAEAADEFTIAVAHVIAPTAMSLTPEMYGTDEAGFRHTLAWGSRIQALKRAREAIEMVRAHDGASLARPAPIS